MKKCNSIIIDGVEYLPKDDLQPAMTYKGLKYCIVRTYSAGVFAGYLESRNDREVVVRKARRIWYWDGAATLSQLAVDGTVTPDKCQFPCEVDRIELLEVIEILDCTEKARLSIQGVPVWKR